MIYVPIYLKLLLSTWLTSSFYVRESIWPTYELTILPDVCWTLRSIELSDAILFFLSHAIAWAIERKEYKYTMNLLDLNNVEKECGGLWKWQMHVFTYFRECKLQRIEKNGTCDVGTKFIYLGNTLWQRDVGIAKFISGMKMALISFSTETIPFRTTMLVSMDKSMSKLLDSFLFWWN